MRPVGGNLQVIGVDKIVRPANSQWEITWLCIVRFTVLAVGLIWTGTI